MITNQLRYQLSQAGTTDKIYCTFSGLQAGNGIFALAKIAFRVYFILMMKFLEHRYTLPCILIAAFILRIIPAWSALSHPERLSRPDTDSYLVPARALAEGSGYPTTRRPPGYPLLAAAVYSCGGSDRELVLLQVLLSVGVCALTGVAAAAFAGKVCGNAAAALAACDLTAIANAPLLLSDTFFALFAAGQLWFFIRYRRSCRLADLLLCTFTAAAAVLIRPINLPMIAVLTVLVAFVPEIPWRRKALHAALSILLFFAVITPWMYRNHRAGAPFTIDTNTGAMRHQNGAALMAKVKGTDFESEKKRLLEEEAAAFADTAKFPDERSREAWRIAGFRRMIAAHPVTYTLQHFDLRVLIPDAPTFLEDFGVTSSDRGTMGVLQKQGIAAAIRHYFGENWLTFILMLIPLLLPTALLYLACACRLVQDLFRFRRRRDELLLFLAFAEYYLFLPGAITAPRYQLPALPCLCLLAGCAVIDLLESADAHVEDPPVVEV